jgi:hypothetical protein
LRRFIADHQSAFSQKILDIPIAQREPEVEPDSMSDDVRWKSVAGVGDGLLVHFRQEAPWLGEPWPGCSDFRAQTSKPALDRCVGIGQGEDRWGFSPVSTTWAMVDVEVGNVS